MESQPTHIEFCRQTITQYDPDRYLISLFSKQRDALWTLYAFHHEIAKTRLVVTEPTLGLIRLQWWRDEIEKIYNNEAHAPGEVLSSLAHVIKAYNLPHGLLEEMISARAMEVRGEQPEGFDGALQFIDIVQTPLLKLALLVEGSDIEIEPVAPVALNYGVIDVIRRAKPKSLIAQNIADVIGVFEAGIKIDSRVLQAHQKTSEIYMNHFNSGQQDIENQRWQRPPAMLALRLWTSMLLK